MTPVDLMLAIIVAGALIALPILCLGDVIAEVPAVIVGVRSASRDHSGRMA